MATIISHSELVHNAVQYVLETKVQFPEKRLDALVEEAAMRYNLSPLEAESLLRLLQEDTTRGEQAEISKQ